MEKLKSILKTSGSFVSGNKPVLVARIFAEVEATKWKQESFLKYPEWLPDLVIPMSFKARSALLKSVNNTTYTVLTEEYAMCLPQFTQDQLNFILMTPSTSALFPYSKSLIRCELFQEQDITLKFRHHKNNVIVWNKVKPSFKTDTHSVFLCYHLPPGTYHDEPLILGYFMSNNLTRFCTCKNGTSSNCSHIALTFRQIAILQGVIKHKPKSYVSAIKSSVNTSAYRNQVAST